ncbi:MAG: DNA gyrase modulator, partial [Actinomycetota bacterium]
MLDHAKQGLEAALAAGADYADTRVITEETESLTVRDQVMEGIDRSTSTGIGIRVLAGGHWGFAATARSNDADEVRRTAELAVQIARAASRVPGEPVRLAEVEPAVATWSSPMQEDPFTVSLQEKIALLMEASRRMQMVDGVTFAEAGLDFFRRKTAFVSSEGAEIRQT